MEQKWRSFKVFLENYNLLSFYLVSQVESYITNPYVCIITCVNVVATQNYVFQVEVFWIVTPYYFAIEYQCFGGLCCIHLKGKYEGSKVRNITRHHNTQEGLNLQRRGNFKVTQIYLNY
jgi:hypothetical protein